jgi:hypothetical protein
MALSADELRVVRGALAIALKSYAAPECRELSDALDEAAREADRMRAFLLADLARYRTALPGTAAGYTDLLQAALAGGYQPQRADLAALRSLCALPAGDAETARRTALLRRCERTADGPDGPPRLTVTQRTGPPDLRPSTARLLALPGGRSAQESEPAPEKPRPPAPERPAKPDRAPAAAPNRPVPTPAEVFPPRRRPAPPAPPEELLRPAAKTA